MSTAPLRILYVAAGIPAPGSVGGSTHVVEVAAGLARRGHEVVTIAGPAAAPPPPDWPENARIINVRLPKALAIGALPAIWRAGRALRPDVVIERYYNFSGGGLVYARRHRLPTVLEVNAPLWDPPGSPKDRLDRLLPGHPLRRWACWQARAADRIITPLPEIVTLLTPHPGIVRLPWGANTDLFDPAAHPPAARAAMRLHLGIPGDAVVAVFAGSFRRWHGVEGLLDAAEPLMSTYPALHLLLIGHGERWEWARTRSVAPPFAGRITLTGAIPYQQVPAHLASADFAVAPFDLSAHAPLREIGFYWSPLKLFEAMAMAVPVIVPAIEELTEVARDGREGLSFPAGDITALTRALTWLIEHPEARLAMGQRARQRVEQHFSWAAHCQALEEVLLALRERRALPAVARGA